MDDHVVNRPLPPPPAGWPSHVFAGPPAAEPGQEWYVLRTRSRQEKILARELAAAGVPCKLPLVRQSRCYAGREVVVEDPQYPGYVFLFGTAGQAEAVAAGGRVLEAVPLRPVASAEARAQLYDGRNRHP